MFRIAYICRRQSYPLGIGGAEVSSYLILKRLGALGHKVMLFGETAPEELYRFEFALREIFGNIERHNRADGAVFLLADGMKFAACQTPRFSRFYQQIFQEWKPDFIFTHLDGSLEAASYACDRRICLFHFIRDVDHPYNFAPLMAPWIDQRRLNLLSNSDFVRRRVLELFGRDSAVIYPEPLDCRCQARAGGTEPGKYQSAILYVNPHESKGSHIALQLIRAFPQYEFHVVEGWDETGLEPFKGFPNVVIHRHLNALCSLYRTCNVLIVPSQRSEAFSRVACEGLQHGMVVAASGHSGLVECIGNGGILVKDYTSPTAWIECLRSIQDDRQIFERYRADGLSRFQQLYASPPSNVLHRILCSRGEGS